MFQSPSPLQALPSANQRTLCQPNIDNWFLFFNSLYDPRIYWQSQPPTPHPFASKFFWNLLMYIILKHGSLDGRGGKADQKSEGPAFEYRLDPMRLASKHKPYFFLIIRLWTVLWCLNLTWPFVYSFGREDWKMDDWKKEGWGKPSKTKKIIEEL